MTKKKVKLQPGDILSFKLDAELFGFAKVLAKPDLGDAIEVYNYFSSNQNDYIEAIISEPLFEQPVILDGYSIFWKRVTMDWDVVGKDETFNFSDTDRANIKFKYGIPGLHNLVDLNGVNYMNIPQEEAEKYPDYSPYSHGAFLHRVKFLIERNKSQRR